MEKAPAAVHQHLLCHHLNILKKMNEQIIKIQENIDLVKNQLSSNDEFATLSGIGVLPRNWIVDPYVANMQTGIAPKTGDNGNVRSFVIEYKGHILKHNIDDEICECNSNTTLTLQTPVASGDIRIASGFSQEEKNQYAENLKNNKQIEGYMIKTAELNFLTQIKDYIVNKE